VFYQERGFIGLDEIWVWGCRFGTRSIQVPTLRRVVSHAGGGVGKGEGGNWKVKNLGLVWFLFCLREKR